MSKGDFIALADALRSERPGINWSPNKHVQWNLDVKAIANVCAASNVAFKRDRWLSYVMGECGPNGGKIKTVKNDNGGIIKTVKNDN